MKSISNHRTRLNPTSALHENFTREQVITISSEQSFGKVMAAACGLLAIVNWWHHGHTWVFTAAIAVLFFVLVYVYPRALKPLNWLWFRFGLILHAVVTPIVMGLLFYAAVWPTGLAARLMGKDILRLKREPNESSYWIVRRPPGPSAETLKDQF